jgi:hypothetical protein
VATHAREAADRAPALQATRAREAADPAPALQSARDTRPSGGANHPDTRECAVALALTLKLDGAAPEDVETTSAG